MPNKLAGSYASCPRCQGRFWVSKDAPLDPSVSDSVGIAVAQHADIDRSAASPTPPVAQCRHRRRRQSGRCRRCSAPHRRSAPPGIPASGTAFVAGRRRGSIFPPRTPPAPAAGNPLPLPPVDGLPTVPPAAPPQARKVARLVSADTAQSTLKLAADGQLPHLQLQEDDKKDNGKGKSRSIPPWS